MSSKINRTINTLKDIVKKTDVLGSLYTDLHLLRTKRIENNTIKQLKKLEQLNEREVYDFQQKMLVEMLTYAYENTKYYKVLFDKNKVNKTIPEDLKKIPYLTKEIIRENLEDLISKDYEIQHLAKRSTGGSTGQPLVFYSNTEAGLIDFGHHKYNYAIMGYQEGEFIVGCGGFKIPEGIRKDNVYWSKKGNEPGQALGDYMFSVLYLNEETIPFYIKKLQEIRPSILRGYPSFYYNLAQYILTNKITLGFEVKGVNLTAEMCSKFQRETIEKAFSTMVYFEYGHKEISLLCCTIDDTYMYRSSPLYGYVEVLDDNGEETEMGQVGNIITTGFNNRGMPFIRYNTGDLGKVIYKNGGVVHFEEIHGRNQDYLINKKGHKKYIIATIYGNKLKAFNHFKRWQLRQTKIGETDILIIKNPEFSISDENEILASFKFFEDIDFKIKYVDDIPKTKIGKHQFLVQEIKL